MGSALFDGSLRGGQAGDGYTEGGAGNIVQAHTVAELHRGGIAAVLTTDAQMQVGVSGTAQLGSHLDQTAHALLVQLGKGIVLIDLPIVVGIQELARVVTAEAEGHLSQVVGAKGEEVGLLGDFVSGDSARGISIMVPTLYFMSDLTEAMMASAVSVTTFFT